MGGERVWFKSSYSNTDGGACLEVALAWRKSTHSNSEGGACVEVAACPHTVHIRDSKQSGTGPRLAFPADAWSAFLLSTARS
ncbi:DUF397 domain-containing protein [Streptomyces nanshensis]|uniref:Toxin n=1 Tax=Streptomyces nanshensis TaxID=518642 RepID=A0A1E7KQI5_9ACTN|nr:DUF397 domain-containing protein [Streptomyces nanshensis]OEV06154.1 toxin [Streptomyces nanshensis]